MNRLFFLLCLLIPAAAAAQSIPYLTDDEIRTLANEFSGDRAFEHIRVLSRWHRDSGMEGFFKAADYVMEAAKAVGLEDVHFVEQTMDAPNYTARQGELWMTEPVEVKLADIAEAPVTLADGSHSADTTAEVVWIGDADDTLSGLDVRGKIVLTNKSPGSAVQRAVYDKGAVGVVSFQTSEGRNPLDEADQIAWQRIGVTPPAGKAGTFAFMLSPRRGEMLHRLLATHAMQDIFATGKKTMGGRAVLHARVKTEIGKTPGRTGFVEGIIRGTQIHDQQIILTAHLQEEKSSANDDGSGCANILEIARTLITLSKEGKIQKPLRDIRFWWTDEISAEYRYFEAHPGDPKNYLADLHQDMVGAKQSMGSRVQHLILEPFSRTSWLDAVFESVGNYLILSNNAFLAASRAGGLPRPYTRPILSTRGSQEAYNARFVPYFNSSDHMTFLEGIIGVPAVATINWDDPYIHSSEDDLYQVDQTQLRRNQFLMGATAYILATMTPAKVPLLADETYAQGLRRLAADQAAAARVLEESKESPDGGWGDAAILPAEGVQREMRALSSVAVFARGDARTPAIVTDLSSAMAKKGEGMTADLAALYRQLHGAPPPELPGGDSLARAAASKVPANGTNLKEYFDNRGKVRTPAGLHSLMRDEAYNFVDGKRSYLDIYKAVRAEQLAGGSWYYGTVTLRDVVALLDAAVSSGTLTLR